MITTPGRAEDGRAVAERIVMTWVRGKNPLTSHAEIVDDIEAAIALARREALEEAAAWHDQRAIDTPDAFEMEFHQASAAAIRSLSASPVARERDETADERQARIVAWLRNGHYENRRTSDSIMQRLADAIERGDHLAPRSDRPSEG